MTYCHVKRVDTCNMKFVKPMFFMKATLHMLHCSPCKLLVQNVLDEGTFTFVHLVSMVIKVELLLLRLNI